MGSRIAATRPVIPSPNGTTARPIWKRSRPFVAASVRRVPSRSSRYSDETLAPSASRVPSTTVSSSSSQVWAVVARPSSSVQEAQLARSASSRSAPGAAGPARAPPDGAAAGAGVLERRPSAITLQA